MQFATGAIYVNALRTINTGRPLRGGVHTFHPCSPLPFVSLSFVSLLSFFFPFSFCTFVSKCVDAIPRAGRTKKGRGQWVGREKGELHEGYLTNFTLTRACVRAHMLSPTTGKGINKRVRDMLKCEWRNARDLRETKISVASRVNLHKHLERRALTDKKRFERFGSSTKKEENKIVYLARISEYPANLTIRTLHVCACSLPRVGLCVRYDVALKAAAHRFNGRRI